MLLDDLLKRFTDVLFASLTTWGFFIALLYNFVLTSKTRHSEHQATTYSLIMLLSFSSTFPFLLISEEMLNTSAAVEQFIAFVLLDITTLALIYLVPIGSTSQSQVCFKYLTRCLKVSGILFFSMAIHFQFFFPATDFIEDALSLIYQYTVYTLDLTMVAILFFQRPFYGLFLAKLYKIKMYIVRFYG